MALEQRRQREAPQEQHRCERQHAAELTSARLLCSAALATPPKSRWACRKFLAFTAR